MVKTDHKNLTYFTTSKVLSRRQARWSEELSQYNFRIEHQKGTDNGQADALSRRPDYAEGMEKPEGQLLKLQPNGSLARPRKGGRQLLLLAGTLDKTILTGYQEDTMAQELKQSKEPYIQITGEGYILFYGKLYVPPKQVNQILQHQHDEMGHTGYQKTWRRIRTMYYFPNMKTAVREYVNKCAKC